MRFLSKLSFATFFVVVAMAGFSDQAYSTAANSENDTTPAAIAPKGPPPKEAKTPKSAPPSSGNEEIEAALKACSESSAKDDRGGPNRAAVDSCMKGKGFEPPKNGAGGPPPKGEKAPTKELKDTAS